MVSRAFDLRCQKVGENLKKNEDRGLPLPVVIRK